MKLRVTIALTCALFSKAYPLDCFECVATGTGPCSQTTKTCPTSQTKCASFTAAVTLGGIQTTTKIKSCTAPTQCLGGSINSEILMLTVNTQCCESNLCNNQEPPVPPVGTVKGCASQSVCSGALNPQLGAIVDLHCCEGNLCNNALRIGQSILFLLLVPLASFFLFN